MFYSLVSPFDAFYEIKWRGKGNGYIATAILLLYGLVSVASVQYTGFIVNTTPSFQFNSVVSFLVAVVPVLLFVISNWSVATLFNGKGKTIDLYLVVCYSLFPLLVTTFLTMLLSNIIILDEYPLLLTFQGIGTTWFVISTFCGVVTVHEYTVTSAIGTVIATAIAAVIIIFMCVLYLSLMEQLISFGNTFIQEAMRRW